MARREHALPSGLSPGRRSHRNPARLSRAHELARRTVNRRIGLLGGSFNPAHSGHRAISLAAIDALDLRSEEHTSELQSLMRISYAVFCLKKKQQRITQSTTRLHP